MLDGPTAYRVCLLGAVVLTVVGLFQSWLVTTSPHDDHLDVVTASMKTPPLKENLAGTDEIWTHSMNITVGVVANEFFDPALGRTGGFGMATNMLGKVFARWPNLGVSIVFVFASPDHGNSESELLTQVNHTLLGWPLISMVSDKQKAAHALWHAAIDVLLLIDYRDDYDKVIEELPGIPVILWARDPRTNQQIKNLEGIRLPHYMQYDERPFGVGAPRATRAVNIFNKLDGGNSTTGYQRKMVIAATWMPALRDRLWEAYHIPVAGNVFELPNIVEGCLNATTPKSKTPAVMFMGRLDPYKRPWLAVELAKRFPKVKFWVFGRRHFNGSGSYDITQDSGQLPKNIQLFGQMTGDEKWEYFQKAWFVISTSAHEGLAINYLESLQCGTPVLSTVDPGGIVSSYGIFSGEFSGSGEQGLPELQKGFQRLLDDETLRKRLGNAGRQHVLETHSAERFLHGFQMIVGHLDFSGGRAVLPVTQPTESATTHPITIVVPSFSRMDTLPALLAHLLNLDNMQHFESEILVVHVSEASWNLRAAIHTDTNRIVVSRQKHSAYEVSKLIHLDFVTLNKKWGCASRHFAALEASNDVLIHLDDDLLPSDEVIAKMIWHVRKEPGFPLYVSGSSHPHFYGSTLRYCGPDGYHVYRDEKDYEPSRRFILTNFVSMSSYLNREFVSAFQETEFYQLAMSKFKGNGCDLIFNHFALTHVWSQPQTDKNDIPTAYQHTGGVLDQSLKYDEINKTGYQGPYGGSTHFLVRNETCRCLHTNFTSACLEEIQEDERPLHHKE